MLSERCRLGNSCVVNFIISVWLALVGIVLCPIHVAYYTAHIDGERLVTYGSPVPHMTFSGVSSMVWVYDFLGLGLNGILWGLIFFGPIWKIRSKVKEVRIMYLAVLGLFMTASMAAFFALYFDYAFEYLTFGGLIQESFFGKGYHQVEGFCISSLKIYYFSDVSVSGLICNK